MQLILMISLSFQQAQVEVDKLQGLIQKSEEKSETSKDDK